MRDEMTVGELIAKLEEMDESSIVRLAQQPAWAFEYTVGEVAEAQLEDGSSVVYIGEGSQISYLPHEARVALDWAAE